MKNLRLAKSILQFSLNKINTTVIKKIQGKCYTCMKDLSNPKGNPRY